MTKSLRLNKSIRADILSNIMQAYSDENAKPVVNDNRGTTLAEAILTWYNAKNVEVIELYNNSTDIMKRFFKSASYFYYLDFNGHYHQVYFSGSASPEDVMLPLSNDVFVNLKNEDTVLPDYVQAVIDNNSKLAKIIRKERQAVTEYEDEYDRYSRDVEQVLAGVNTTVQLTTVWPEVEKFLPKGMSNPTMISLPSVNVGLLNRKLG